MNERYNTASITQNVEVISDTGHKYEVMREGSSPGFKLSLEREYLHNLKEYLEDDSGKCNRFVLIADSKYVARQAYLIINAYRRVNMKSNETGEYIYEPLKGAGAKKISEHFSYNYVIIPEKKQKNGDMGEYMRIDFPPVANAFSAAEKDEIEKAEHLFIEAGSLEDADEMADSVKSRRNESIAIWLRPGADNQYFLKRVCFECDFVPIILHELSKKDCINCAESFLKQYHLECNENILAEKIGKLRSFRGSLFSEQDIYTYLSKAMDCALKAGRSELEENDFSSVVECSEKSASDKLEKLIGLENAKMTLKRMLAARSALKDKDMPMHQNMFFAGPPGVGKSTIARLYAELLAENELSNGKFVDATKADLVAKYCGQTAHLVKKVFEKARGGVLFIDEAGFLLSTDTFVNECVVELVRFCELYPDVTVILATYEDEAKKVLDLDSGLRSRFSRIVHFEPYSADELWAIFCSMAADAGFEVSSNAKKTVERYINSIKGGASFANAREMRKLFEASLEEFGLKNRTEDELAVISDREVKQAVSYLLGMGNSNSSYGFIA